MQLGLFYHIHKAASEMYLSCLYVSTFLGENHFFFLTNELTIQKTVLYSARFEFFAAVNIQVEVFSDSNVLPQHYMATQIRKFHLNITEAPQNVQYISRQSVINPHIKNETATYIHDDIYNFNVALIIWESVEM